MKQITLYQFQQPDAAAGPCTGRLVTLGVLYGIGMLFLWRLAGPTALGHAVVWGLGAFAGLTLWRAAEEA